MSRYRVTICSTCPHPAGQHRMNAAQACVLCDCPGWIEPGHPGYWSNEEQRQAESSRAAQLRRRAKAPVGESL